MEKGTGEMMANSSMITNGGGGESSGQKYKGVRKRKWGKWVSEVRLPNSRERIWLGSYDTAEKAARAFDAAQFCLRGRHAHFNFPDSPPDIPGGRSLSPQEIQAVAARFAEEHEQENIIQLHDNNNHHFNNCDNILTDPEYFSSSTSQEVIPNPNFMTSSGDTIGHEMSNGSINTDWSFLNFLDYDGAAAYNADYDHHFDDNQYNLFSGQLYEINSGVFSTAEVPVLPQAPSATDDSFFSTRGDDDDQNINVVNGDDLIFSHNSSSFLWNF